jgi:hypothetical protein
VQLVLRVPLVLRVQLQVRSVLAVVHCGRSGQVRQAAPKVTEPVGLTGRVIPAGQVACPASWSMVKSSRVNPPSTAAAAVHFAVLTVHDLRRRTGSGAPANSTLWFASWYVRSTEPSRDRGWSCAGCAPDAGRYGVNAMKSAPFPVLIGLSAVLVAIRIGVTVPES